MSSYSVKFILERVKILLSLALNCCLLLLLLLHLLILLRSFLNLLNLVWLWVLVLHNLLLFIHSSFLPLVLSALFPSIWAPYFVSLIHITSLFSLDNDTVESQDCKLCIIWQITRRGCCFIKLLQSVFCERPQFTLVLWLNFCKALMTHIVVLLLSFNRICPFINLGMLFC